MTFPTIALLAGGKGKRLWPLSNDLHPKQFIKLPAMGLSSFQLTLKRALDLTNFQHIIIGVNHRQAKLVKQQIYELNLVPEQFNILQEPNNINTGLAIYDICKFCVNEHHNNLTYFFPTDQIIEQTKDFFLYSLSADPQKITIFGQKNKHIPSSNLGCIILGKKLYNNNYEVTRFIEKPSKKQTKILSQQDNYSNLGIYLAKPSVLLDEFHILYPDLATGAFTQIPFLSIDQMIAEKSHKLNCITVDFNWWDCGSIDELHKRFGENSFDNCNIDEYDIALFNETNEN